MDNNICQSVYRWLKESGIQVSRNILKQKLSSHPDFPSIRSITDTLDEWQIPNAALVIDQEKFAELPTPFLISTNTTGTHFQLINKAIKQTEQVKSYLKDGNGIILALEKPGNLEIENNQVQLKADRLRQALLKTCISLILLVFFTGLIFNPDWITTLLLLTNLGGLLFSILVVQKEIGIDNRLTSSLCSTKNTDCDSVLHSREANLFSWLQFSDLGIVWFSSWSIIHIISLFTGSSSEMLSAYAWINLASIPITILSIYYQFFKIKKWCPICLLTICLIWIQSIVLFFFLVPLNSGSSQLLEFVLIALTFLSVFTAWGLMIGPMVKLFYRLESENLNLQRFRLNTEIFSHVLFNGKPIDSSSWPDELQIGNPNSTIQLLVACNPYCTPCAGTHQFLSRLVEHRDIGLTIRFVVKSGHDDQMSITIQYLLSLLHGKSILFKRNVLHRWFELMNLETFKKEYPQSIPANVQNRIDRLVDWSRKTKIRFTPTIFINGYPLPEAYNVYDLPRLIAELQYSSSTLGKIQLDPLAQ